jgi:WD40 repeat protein
MTPEAEALFLDALDLSPTERRRFLDARTDGAPDLRAEVESLLRADAEAEGFLEPPPVAADEGDDAFGRWLEGRRIGQYTIQRRIGLGGMSTVYEAMQDRPRRRVALKLLRAGLSTRELRRRFEQEAEILGRLRHPAIAEIYEAGTHESEVGPIPFFALEFVADARSLTRFAQKERLSPDARLALLAQVCRAVHHAHEHGVIHRDLKPSNILVGTDGRPKLIDFGVARAIDDEMRAVTLRTSVGDMLGTLYYMSPEQCAADGRPIDARTDVYSLGVVLYELLTGRLPYPIETTAGPAVPELIREHVPRAPTTGTHRRRRDVDAVVLTALEKDPARRYASAAELADDIDRCVRGEPPRASHTRRGHQVGRAVWRMRRAAPLLLGGGLMAWGLASLVPGVDEHAAYIHCITAAQQAFEGRDMPRAKALLSECAMSERGWEWHRLDALVDRSAAVLPVGSPLHALVWSPAAARLVAATEDGRVVAWAADRAAVADVPRFSQSWTVRVSRPLDALAIDEARGVVYGGGEGRGISAWRLSDGAPLEGLPGLEREVWGLVVDPAGTRIYAANHGGELAAWDLASRDRSFHVRVDASIDRLALSPDGTTLLLSHTDGTIGIHDAIDGRSERRLGEHSDAVEVAVWTPSGVVSGGWDDRLRRFDPRTGDELAPLGTHADGILDLALVSSDTIASASRDGTIALWDVSTAAPGPVLRGHDYGVEAIAVDTGGRWIASASLDGTLRVWDLHEAPTDRRLREPRDKVHALAWADGGRVLVGAAGPQWGHGDGDQLVAWAMPEGRVIAEADDHARTIDALAVSTDGRRVATGSRDGEIVVRDRATLAPLGRAHVHTGRVEGLAFSAGDAQIVSVGEDGDVAWIGADDAELVRRVAADAGPLAAVAIPSRDCLVVVGETALVRIDESGELVRWPAPQGDVWNALAVLDEARVVVGSGDGVVTLLDLSTLQPVWSSATFGRGVNALDVAPDRSRIAVASADYRIRLLDVQTGELAFVVGSHASVATSVAFSPTGETIASGGFDRSVRLWTAPIPSGPGAR